jgi:hypothetical protein
MYLLFFLLIFYRKVPRSQALSPDIPDFYENVRMRFLLLSSRHSDRLLREGAVSRKAD